MAKKILKIIRNVLLCILAFIILGTTALFISHRVQLSSEEKMLAAEGYLNRVSVGEYRLNVCSYGSDAPEHTIVGLSGRGIHNYSAALRNVTDRFADKNRIVFVDRAGYGLSDDTNVPQTAERIVEDYRNALKNAGFQAPYILLPHSLGGIYATYWASGYPEEIEGIVLLDCSEITSDEPVFDFETGFTDYAEMLLCKLGFQRPCLRLFDAEAFYEVPDELSDINKALLMNKSYTRAMISETELINKNCAFVYNNIVKTDIPKLYIADLQKTREDITEMFEMMNELKRKTGEKEFEPPKDVDAYLEAISDFFDETVIPYADSLGNCEIRTINGTHMLYYHKPEETADMIEEFLKALK